MTKLMADCFWTLCIWGNLNVSATNFIGMRTVFAIMTEII